MGIFNCTVYLCRYSFNYSYMHNSGRVTLPLRPKQASKQSAKAGRSSATVKVSPSPTSSVSRGAHSLLRLHAVTPLHSTTTPLRGRRMKRFQVYPGGKDFLLLPPPSSDRRPTETLPLLLTFFLVSHHHHPSSDSLLPI